MQREVTVAEVRTAETRGGNVRWIVRDSDGNEYTTFREQIGAGLTDLEGKRARIEYHEQHRGQYTNVYLDSIERVDTPAAGADPEQVARDIEDHRRAEGSSDAD